MDTMSKTTWLGILDDARFPQPTSEFLLQLQGGFAQGSTTTGKKVPLGSLLLTSNETVPARLVSQSQCKILPNITPLLIFTPIYTRRNITTTGSSFPHINKKKIVKYLLISNCIKMSRYFLSFRLDGRVIVFPYVNSFSDFDTTLRKERDQDLNNLRALVATNKVRS